MLGLDSLKVKVTSLFRSSSSKSSRPAREVEVAITFTDHEKRLLRCCWSTDFQELYEVGVDIYTEIFLFKPDIQQVFTYLAGYKAGDTSWKEIPQFKKQALRFVQTLDKCMNRLTMGGDLTELEKDLKALGKRHRRFVDRGFRTEYWHDLEIVIAKVMTRRIHALPPDAFREEADRDKTSVAWSKLAAYIIRKMEEGFLEK